MRRKKYADFRWFEELNCPCRAGLFFSSPVVCVSLFAFLLPQTVCIYAFRLLLTAAARVRLRRVEKLDKRVRISRREVE